MASVSSRCCDAIGIASLALIALLILTTVLMAFLHWVFEPLEAFVGPLLSLRGLGWLGLGTLIWLVAGRPENQDHH